MDYMRVSGIGVGRFCTVLGGAVLLISVCPSCYTSGGTYR